MPAAPKRTHFGLMRHAPTQWNLVKRIQGMGDSDLTPEGEQLAEQWGQCLRSQGWNRILASDLGRAQKTARLVNNALQLPVATTERLREMDWGQWTGLTLQHIKAEHRSKLAEMVQAGWNFKPPGGESRGDVRRRGDLALREAAGAWPGEKILVITHGGVLKALIYDLLQRAYLPAEPLLLRPGHLHRVAVEGGRLILEGVNAVDLNGR
jgi:broad specificity phosphatase PhoE